jgi:4-hydroxy-3-methylbut-2-enyl diphosphate reductase
VDLILAIGGLKSSNTARLADVGNQMGVTSYHIERPEDIRDEWLEAVGDGNVGVTAGASTPDDVIQEVVDYLAARGLTPPDGGVRPVDPTTCPPSSPQLTQPIPVSHVYRMNEPVAMCR